MKQYMAGCWRQTWPTLGWTLAFLVSITASVAALKRPDPSLTLKALCVVTPLAFGVTLLHSTYRMIRNSDELVRRIFLEALAVAAIGAWILSFMAPILERAGIFSRVDASWFGLAIGGLFLAGYYSATKRYSA